MKARPENFTIDPQIEAAIRARAADGTLHCAQAFTIAKDLDVPPILVGQTADALEVRLDRCQLGLYGYPDHAKGWQAADMAARAVPEGLEDAIHAATDAQGHLTCTQAWKIAATFNIPKMLVGYIADHMDVHIVQCQLGAF